MIISPLSTAQSYLIIQSKNSIFVPLGSQICTDYIIVNNGAGFITEDTNGTCSNAVVSRLGKAVSSVELISFKAGINENKNILLTWETTNDNNSSFNIERFNPDNLTFEKIGFVAAYKNSQAKKSYSFIDKSASLNKNHNYRLAQVNKDNSISILNTLSVQAFIPDEYFISQNYPNPFNPSTKISYRIPQQDHVMLKIYDVLGNEVCVPINEEKQAGNYEVTLNLDDLPSGIYFYELQAGSFIQTKKMILLR